MSEQTLKKEKTSHPYIIKNKDVCNGSPIIEGTRTRAIDIAVEYEILGRSPDEIIRSHPHVNLYQIHDAFSARDRDKLGLTDEEQLFFASQEKATIFTHDV